MLERVEGLGIIISKTTGEEPHEEVIEWVAAYCLIECLCDFAPRTLELNCEKASYNGVRALRLLNTIPILPAEG